ncbi:LuxR C-terminal-related transcriptional regulator [Winogradskyella sp.]|uniref:response regulator transcription factor n=1 Tax=Winogradskyella sp. TaxID=1883156 RepID=UPI0025EB9FDD|nr:LuxR C-terminal-related transcriptional regulator [Winogradskyella sp.]
MKKSSKTAEFQLLQLIIKLRVDSKSLNYNEFIAVLNATKSLYSNKHFIEGLIQSLRMLNHTEIQNKGNLTKREKQVLILIGEGLKSVSIANKLNLSKSTIETHRKNIRKKLKLNGSDNLFTIALLFNLQYQKNISDDKS